MTRKYQIAPILLFASLVPTEAWNNLVPNPRKIKRRVSAKTPTNPRQQTPLRGPPALPPPPPSKPDNQFSILPENLEMPEIDIPNPITPNLWNSATSSLLRVAANFAPKDVQEASNRAARLTVNSLPPQSVEIDLSDVPIIGNAVSGTYAKVKTLPSNKQPSVKIASPKDKFSAIQTAADTGNLQFGLNGLFQSVLDIQLQPNQPGVAPVEIKSPLIPKWPFGKHKSDWNKVTNVGNGETYYFNAKTGETQTQQPINM